MELVINSSKYGTCRILIDDADYQMVLPFKWRVSKIHGIYYVSGRIESKTRYLHRFLLNVTDRNQFVDHRDGNGLNNLRSNLRLASRSNNAHNQKMNKNNTSGYRGVCEYAPGKFRASIKYAGKNRLLGHFTTAEAASAAYEARAKQVHQDFYRAPTTEPCASGERISKRCKLSREQVNEIRAKYKPHRYTAKDLATEYSISHQHISKIVCGVKRKI